MDRKQVTKRDGAIGPRGFWLGLVLIGLGGAALGLSVAFAQAAFGIAPEIVQWFWVALLALTLMIAAIAAYHYYLALRDYDDWQ